MLTFANEITLPKPKSSSMLLKHFSDQLTMWERLLQKAVADNVPVVPVILAGYRDELSLPDCKNWLSRLRTRCFDIAKPISSSINWGKLQPSEEVKQEDTNNRILVMSSLTLKHAITVIDSELFL